jgi:hypothetical protein
LTLISRNLSNLKGLGPLIGTLCPLARKIEETEGSQARIGQ